MKLSAELPGVKELCDFCHQPRGEDHRMLFHNASKTVCVCNYCVLVLHKQLMEIDTLRFAPLGTQH